MNKPNIPETTSSSWKNSPPRASSNKFSPKKSSVPTGVCAAADSSKRPSPPAPLRTKPSMTTNSTANSDPATEPEPQPTSYCAAPLSNSAASRPNAASASNSTKRDRSVSPTSPKSSEPSTSPLPAKKTSRNPDPHRRQTNASPWPISKT